MTALHAAAVATLTAWQPPSMEQDALRHAFLAYLDARPDACARSCVPGHLTASLVLLDATAEHVLLTLHPRVGRWLQLGGHCEPHDRDPAAVAMREAAEESGITGIQTDRVPVHLAVYPAVCTIDGPTRHFDIAFFGIAPDGAPAPHDSPALAWWPLNALPENSDPLPAMVAQSMRRYSRSR